MNWIKPKLIFLAVVVVVCVDLYLSFSGVSFFQNLYVEAFVLIFAVIVGSASGIAAASAVFQDAKINPKKEIQVIGVSILAAWSGGLVIASTMCPAKVAPTVGWCIAFIALGTFIGFLFAIPRVQQDGTDGKGANDGGKAIAYRLMVNTNLEQVSDWLTKIIIGLGLVNLKQIPGYLRQLGERFMTWVPDAGPVAPLIGQSTAIYFSITGFFGGYLITRLYLSGILNAVEAGLFANILPTETTAVLTQTIDVTRKDAPIPLENQAAASKIVQTPVEALSSNPEKGLWAKAQVLLGNYRAAVPIFRYLVSADSGDVVSHLELSDALTLSKNYEEAYKEIKIALGLITPRLDRSILRRIYRSASYLALFQKPPQIDEAIQLGNTYISGPANYPSSSILINLACAYGLKYSSLDPTASKADRDAIEENAYQALKQALAIDPNSTSFLRSLLNTDSPPPDDLNDLVVFGKISRFRQLVGLAI